MNLLMISGDRSVPQGRRGAFWYTLEELAKHWGRIDIICPHVRNPEVLVAHGNIHFHPSPRGLWYQPWWIAGKGHRLHSAYGHHVMTVHEYPPFYNGIGARWLNTLVRIPYVMEVHHIVGVPQPASWLESLGRMLSRPYFPSAARRATFVRTVNNDVKRWLVAWGIPDEKIAIVPSFYLDAATFRNTPQPPVAYDLAFCARLVEHKRLDSVLHALSKMPGVRLLVVGDGPLRSRYEELTHSLHLGDRVTFAGWLHAKEDVVSAMKSARAFVMNSASEGGPRSALEAMASGLPVVTTRVGVMPEIVQDGVNGFFTTGTSEDLTHKIGMLLSNEERRAEMGKEAEKVLERFERSRLVRKYAEFLKGIVK